MDPFDFVRMIILKIKKLFLAAFFFLSCVANTLNAQQVTWSKQIAVDKKLQYMKIIGTDEEGFYTLHSNISFDNDREQRGYKNRRYSLEYFDLELNLKWNQPLESSVPEAKIIDVQILNNKILVISSLADKHAKLYRLFAQFLDNKGIFKGEPLLLDEFSYDKINDESKPGVVISHDRLKAVCAFRKIPVNSKEEQHYETIVIDTNLKIVYKKEIVIPLNTKHFTPLDFVLTNQGNFFLLGMKYQTDKKVKVPNESFYQLYSYNFLHDEISSNEIKIDDRFLTDAGLSADNLNKKVVVAGFYSDVTTYSTAGVFYFSVHEDSAAQVTVNNSAFSSAFLSKFLGERKENNNRELVNYSIDRLILRKDGGAAILAESYSQSLSSYWDYYTQTYISHRYYHFGNVLALSVNPDGSLLWGNSISKDQNSTDDAGYLSSYCSVITGSRIYTIYNKYIESQSSVLITTIDGKGTQQTDVLFNEIKNTSVIPLSAKQIDSETLLLPAYRENKLFIAKIEF